MEDAVAQNDHAAFARSDLEGHSLVWKQAANSHLERALHSMIGPMFMFMANAAEYYDWQETLELHRDLVQCINAGSRAEAQASIERHMANSRDRAIGVLKARPKKHSR
jgi:DNA-binding FadR family transcriptional regulator